MDTNQPDINQWLDQTSILMRTITSQTSPGIFNSAMESILADGESLLSDTNLSDPNQRCAIALSAAEAAANIALEADDAEIRMESIVKCFNLCDQALETCQLAQSSGLMSETGARATTLLVCCGRLVPEAQRLELEARVKRYAGLLEKYLELQAVDRKLGADKLQQGYMFASVVDDVTDLSERRVLLEKAGDEIIQAGVYFLRAHDWKMVEQIRGEMAEVEKSLNDPALPVPHLAVFDIRLEVPERLSTAPQPPETRSAPPRQLPFRRPSRQSLWRVLFSIGGMMISCVSMLLGGVMMMSGFGFFADTSEIEDISKTQVSVSARLTLAAQESNGGVTSTKEAPISPIMATQSARLTQLAEKPSAPTQPTGTIAPIIANNMPTTCPGAPASRLTAPNSSATVGDVGGYSMTVYERPGYDSKELFYYEQGISIKIEAGPVCVGAQWWWQISKFGWERGWAPETTESGEYLINP